MHPDQDLILRPDIALDQGDVLHLIHVIFIDDDFECLRRNGYGRLCGGRPPDQRFVLHPEVDEIGDGNDFKVVFFGENFQIGHPRHGPVVLHDFTDDTRRFQAGEPRQINGPFRLARSHQDASLPGPDGKDMSGADQVIRFCIVGNGRPDRCCPVGGRDAGA